MSKWILGIILILIIAIASILIYLVPFSEILSDDNLASGEKKMFQDILEKYSVCVENENVECQCKYLLESSCERLRGGTNSESIYAINAKLIPSGDGIRDLDSEGSRISGLGPPTQTHRADFYFVGRSGERSGSCSHLSFIKENGKWKVFDVDPAPESFC